MYEIMKEEPVFPSALTLCPGLSEVNAVTMITVIVVAAKTESFFVWEADWRMPRGSFTDKETESRKS